MSHIAMSSSSPAPVCTGCGQCCRKGGPLLHREDMPLAAGGHLPLTALVTLRSGELAHDPVVERLLPLEEEAIKVAGTGEASAPWRCVVHTKAAGCGIYAHRPAQCRALFCADTRALAELYEQRRATRRDLFRHAPQDWPQGMADLAEAHEEQCPLRPLVPLAHAAPHDAEAVAALLEAVRFDLAFRELSVERARIPAAALPCVLGRPVSAFLRTLGLDVRQEAGGSGLRLHRTGPSHYPY